MPLCIRTFVFAWVFGFTRTELSFTCFSATSCLNCCVWVLPVGARAGAAWIRELEQPLALDCSELVQVPSKRQWCLQLWETNP